MEKFMLKNILKKLRILKTLRSSRDLACCFLDFLAEFLLFFKKSQNSEIKLPNKILAIRLDRIGDLILTTPALRAIKETYPQSYLAVLVKHYTKDLIEGLSFIDEVIVCEDFKKQNLVKHLKACKFDVSLVFHPDFYINYISWKAAIPQRIGYKLCGSAIFLTHSLKDDRSSRIRHEVESALEVASVIHANTKDLSLAIAIQEKSESFADDFFNKNNLKEEANTVVIHPGSRQPYIRWRKEGFAEVADRLIRELNTRVILVGSEEEKGLVSGVEKLMKEKPVLALSLALPELASILKKSVLFIGNSTGPMHMASALKVPAVAIFGAIHPKDSYQEWGPWGNDHIVVRKDLKCNNCHPGDCITHACMESVSVEDVFEAARKLLLRK